MPTTNTEDTATPIAPIPEETESESTSIPLKRLCQEANIEPKAARRKLRKATFDWHTMKTRWEFEPDSENLKQARIVLGLEKANS